MLFDSLFWIVLKLITLFEWAVILSAIMSMLVAFNVLDTRNRFVWLVGDFLYRVTEPALRPIRRVIPSFGNIDLSPLVLILALELLERMVRGLYIAARTGNFSSIIF